MESGGGGCYCGCSIWMCGCSECAGFKEIAHAIVIVIVFVIVYNIHMDVLEVD